MAAVRTGDHVTRPSIPEVTLNKQELPNKLKPVLKSWGLRNMQFIYVFGVGESNAITLWRCLKKITDNTLKNGINIAVFIIGPANWPLKTMPEIERFNVPCVRVLCDIRKAPPSINPVFSHILTTSVSKSTFLSYALPLQRKALAIVLANADSMYRGINNNLHSKPWYAFKHTIFLHSSCKTTSGIKGSIFMNITPSETDTLLLEVIEYFNRRYMNNSKRKKLLHPSAEEIGILISYDLPQTADADWKTRYCKNYCVINLKKNKKTFPSFLTDKYLAFHYQVVVTVRKPTEESSWNISNTVCDILEWLQDPTKTSLSDNTKNIGYKGQFIIFDAQAMLFEKQAKLKTAISGVKGRYNRCIAVVPWSKVESMFSKKTPRSKGRLPVRDNNGCIDTYIFLKGDVLDEEHAFKYDVCRFLVDQLTKSTETVYTCFREQTTWENDGTEKREKRVGMGFTITRRKAEHLTNENNEFYPSEFTIDQFSEQQCVPFTREMILLLCARNAYAKFDSPPCVLKTVIKDNLQIRDNIPVRYKLAYSVLKAALDKSGNEEKDLADVVGFLLSSDNTNINSSDQQAACRKNRCLMKALMVENCNCPGYNCDPKQECNCTCSCKRMHHPNIGGISHKEHFPSDLFYAAVHGGNHAVVEKLLKYTNAEVLIANALYAIGTFRAELKTPTMPFTEEKRDNIRISATALEDKAKKVLHDVHRKNANKHMSQKILFSEMDIFGCRTIDLACMADARTFMSDTTCTDAIYNEWWQQLRGKSRRWWQVFLWMLLATFLPCCTPCALTGKNSSSRTQTMPAPYYGCCCRCIYNIPAVRCLVHFIIYFCFVLYFSYVLLDGVGFEMEIVREVIVLVWMVTLFIEELRQLVLMRIASSNTSRSFRKFKKYLSEVWNVIDILVLVFYLMGFILRVIATVTKDDGVLIAAHVFFGLDIITLYIRLLHFFAIHDKIGPLLITIGHMIEDLAYFILILLPVLVGYGVALHLIIVQIVKWDYSIIHQIMYIPYFQIFGELKVDDLLDKTVNETNQLSHEEAPGPRNYIGVFLAGVYVLVANILLMNLLIARFNSSYSKIENNSEFYHVRHKIWILEEYQNKYNLPPPFSILSYIFALVQCGLDKLCCDTKQQSSVEDILLSESNSKLTEQDIKEIKAILEEINGNSGADSHVTNYMVETKKTIDNQTILISLMSQRIQQLEDNISALTAAVNQNISN